MGTYKSIQIVHQRRALPPQFYLFVATSVNQKVAVNPLELMPLS